MMINPGESWPYFCAVGSAHHEYRAAERRLAKEMKTQVNNWTRFMGAQVFIMASYRQTDGRVNVFK